MTVPDLVSELEAALALPRTALIVRSASTISEIIGPLPLRRGTWLTLGEDGGTHVHLRAADVASVRYVASAEANAALEVRGADGEVLCKVSFRHTNESRPERYEREVAVRVQQRFGHLA